MFIIKKGNWGYVKRFGKTAWVFTTDIFDAEIFSSSDEAKKFIENHKISKAELVYCMPCR